MKHIYCVRYSWYGYSPHEEDARHYQACVNDPQRIDAIKKELLATAYEDGIRTPPREIKQWRE